VSWLARLVHGNARSSSSLSSSFGAPSCTPKSRVAGSEQGSVRSTTVFVVVKRQRGLRTRAVLARIAP